MLMYRKLASCDDTNLEIFVSGCLLMGTNAKKIKTRGQSRGRHLWAWAGQQFLKYSLPKSTDKLWEITNEIVISPEKQNWQEEVTRGH